MHTTCSTNWPTTWYPPVRPQTPPPPYQNHFMQNQYLSQGLFHSTPVQNHVNPVVTQHIRPPIVPSNLPYQPVFQNQSNGQSVNPPILENKVSEKQSGLTVQVLLNSLSTIFYIHTLLKCNPCYHCFNANPSQPIINLFYLTV